MATATKPITRKAAFRLLTQSEVAPLEGQRKYFVESNWLRELIGALGRATRNRWAFLILRFFQVAGALVLPALASQALGGSPSQPVQVATFAVSVAVAISTGAIQVFRFGNEWAIDEEYAHALEAEGLAYFQKAGHYRNFDYPEGAYHTFFERIEQLRRLRGERRAADIRGMASEASKEPTPTSRSAPELTSASATPTTPPIQPFKP